MVEQESNSEYRSEFATNRPAVEGRPGEHVADAVNGLLGGLRERLRDTPRVAIATAYFNPGGFNLLAGELELVSGARLLLGAEPALAEDRPRVRPLGERRRRSGPSLEVRKALEGHSRSLAEDRNLLGFTREADVQARRLVTWLRKHPDVQVRRYEEGFLHGKAFIVETDATGVIAGSSNFTFAGLARNNELNLGQYQPGTVKQVLDWFNEQWGAARAYDLAALYEARWSAHQPYDIFLRMLWENYGDELDGEDVTRSRLGLTGFQSDGVFRARRILQKRKGVLIADEVGLGKTFVAGELIHEAVFERRQKVLIVCPATLRDSTWRPFLADKNLRADVVSFEELVADIAEAGSRQARLQNPDQYAMVVVDEAHAMRNDATQRADALRTALAGSYPKDLVLLTATPVNNSLADLYNLIVYFTPNDAAFGDVGIPSLRNYFKRAMEMNPDDLSPEHLFDVLDEVAVRRTRRFVKNHYAGDKVVINGVEQEIMFPTVRVIRVDYNLDKALPGVFDDLAVALGANVIARDASSDILNAGVILDEPGAVLTMARYVPSRFLLVGVTEAYEAQNAGLLRSNLLKRFESSAYAFEQTLDKMITSHARFLDALERGLVLTGDALREWTSMAADDVEEYIEALDDTSEGVGDATDYDTESLHAAVAADQSLLEAFQAKARQLHTGADPKIDALIEELCQVAADAQTEGIGESDTRNKRKTLVFTYYSDTADYLQRQLSAAIATDDRLEAYRNRMVAISGKDRSNRSDVIIGFAPDTAGTGSEEDKYDLVITTDVLAEGVNLQQARHIINFDLPWNPQRLVQRHGRIDRIGSPHREVFMRCFFPDADLDRILGLEERLQRKLKQAAASVGVGEVLPGVAAVDRSITETRDQIARLRAEDAAIFEDGGNAALSGEEFRRMLGNALRSPGTKERISNLPWGSGTGFQRSGADPGFVFCARIGDHAKPWFRYVPLNPDLTIQTEPANPEIPLHIEGPSTPRVIDDILASLSQADPGAETVQSTLSEEMYSAAFDAWAVAQQHIHDAWMFQTDPANLAPAVPRVMRDAAALVREHGRYLGDMQDSLAVRLNAPYTIRVQRQIQRIMRDPGVDERAKVSALHGLATDLGLTPPPEPIRLPVIDLSDIYLVCWTAISPLP
jgi:superfamily II DNA or RNA helicase